MKAFTFTVNGREDFGIFAQIQPIWMKLRGEDPDLADDEELLDEAARLLSKKIGKTVKRKRLG